MQSIQSILSNSIFYMFQKKDNVPVIEKVPSTFTNSAIVLNQHTMRPAYLLPTYNVAFV